MKGEGELEPELGSPRQETVWGGDLGVSHRTQRESHLWTQEKMTPVCVKGTGEQDRSSR